MLRFRRLLITGVNALVLGWLLKVIFLDQGSDVVGLLAVATFLFLLVYNLYAIFFYNLFPSNEQRRPAIEAGFLTLLGLPFLLLYLFTS